MKTGGGDHFLKISASQLLRFWIENVLKILNKRMTDLMNKSVNDEGICKTAPATQGLIKKILMNSKPTLILWADLIIGWFPLSLLNSFSVSNSDLLIATIYFHALQYCTFHSSIQLAVIDSPTDKPKP